MPSEQPTSDQAVADRRGLTEERFKAWKNVAKIIESLDHDSQEAVIRSVCIMFDIRV